MRMAGWMYSSAAVCTFLLIFTVPLAGQTPSLKWVVGILNWALWVSLEAGISGLCLATPLAYPTRIRATAHSFHYGFSRISGTAILAPTNGHALSNRLAIYGAGCAIAAVTVFLASGHFHGASLPEHVADDQNKSGPPLDRMEDSKNAYTTNSTTTSLPSADTVVVHGGAEGRQDIVDANFGVSL